VNSFQAKVENTPKEDQEETDQFIFIKICLQQSPKEECS
jgi:hypothetical protein